MRSTGSIRFGRFELLVAERQLRVDGEPVALGSRAFDVLAALVERRDRVVTKSELLDLAWPGLVVEENNLQVQISALRKLLGASVIATVPGRGYRFTASSSAPVAAASPAGAPVARPLTNRDEAQAPHLLVADDNKVNRLLLMRSLQLLGHRVTCVDNGRLALEALRREPLDLLLLDLEMPELDGFTLLEQRRREPELTDVPVIVTSSLEGVEQVARCIELGAEDYLHKPVNPVLLKARVGASLERKRLRDAQKALIRRLAGGAGSEGDGPGAAALGAQRLEAAVLDVRLAAITSEDPAQSADETMDLLGSWHTLMHDAVKGQGGIVHLVAGDQLMAVFGPPLAAAADAPLAAVRAALDMLDMLESFSAERLALGRSSLAAHIGIASGAVLAGYVSTQSQTRFACVGATIDRAQALRRLAADRGRAVIIDAATQSAVADRVSTDAVAGDAPAFAVRAL
jgi:DNA-binding response OmpR family regulator